MKHFKELHSRSLVKALTWRVIATSTTMSLVYIGTGDIELMAHVGIADVVIKLFFYFCHERVWGHVRWGKHAMH